MLAKICTTRHRAEKSDGQSLENKNKNKPKAIQGQPPSFKFTQWFAAASSVEEVEVEVEVKEEDL